MKKTNIFMAVLFCAVLICGAYGLVQEGYDFLNAVFFTFTMFALNFGERVTSPILYFARYGAMIFSTTFIVTMVEKLGSSIRVFLASLSKGCVFVYGDDELAQKFISSCSCKVINKNEFHKADKYVLLKSDQENLDFYSRYKEEIKGKDVYIKHSVLANTIHGNCHFFSVEQIAARRFWHDNLLIDKAFDDRNQAKKELNIVFAGFNSLAESVLYQSVIANIFEPDQQVKYHLFGDTEAFKKNHINSKELNISYHDKSYFESRKLLEDADVVLFFDSLDMLNRLMGVLTKGDIVFFAEEDISEDVLINHKYGNTQVFLRAFNYKQTITREDVIDDNCLENAKALNESYNKESIHAPQKDKDKLWEELNVFKKMSNIAPMDFFDATVKRLLCKFSNIKIIEKPDSGIKESIDSVISPDGVKKALTDAFKARSSIELGSKIEEIIKDETNTKIINDDTRESLNKSIDEYINSIVTGAPFTVDSDLLSEIANDKVAQIGKNLNQAFYRTTFYGYSQSLDKTFNESIPGIIGELLNNSLFTRLFETGYEIFIEKAGNMSCNDICQKLNASSDKKTINEFNGLLSKKISEIVSADFIKKLKKVTVNELSESLRKSLSNKIGKLEKSEFDELLGNSMKKLTDNELESEIEYLAELEHIRWSNYHYFCNWIYAEERDNTSRKHNCLKPYNDLPEEEKEKDRKQLRKQWSLFKERIKKADGQRK